MSGWSIISEAEAAPEPTPISVARAELLGVRRAPYGRRVLATIIDALPVIVFAIPLWFVPAALSAPDGQGVLLVVLAAVGLLLMVIYALLQVGSHGRRGQTFGKQMMRLRTIRATTFRPIRFGRALGHAALFAAAGVVPVVGTALMALSPLFDPEKRGRGWHDHAVGAWMIDLRAVDPTDPVAFENARGRARVRSVSLANAARATPQAPAAPAPAPGAAAPGVPAPGVPAPAPRPVPSLAPGVAPTPAAPVPQPAAPARPAAPTQPAPAATASVRVRLDDGRSLVVTGPTLIGRKPLAEGAAALVAIDDDTRSVSKTHLALHVDAQGLIVTDRGSSNGSVLVRGTREVPLRANVPSRARSGDRIRFGDRSLEVL